MSGDSGHGQENIHDKPSHETITMPGLCLLRALCKLCKQRLKMVDLGSIKLY